MTAYMRRVRKPRDLALSLSLSPCPQRHTHTHTHLASRTPSGWRAHLAPISHLFRHLSQRDIVLGMICLSIYQHRPSVVFVRSERGHWRRAPRLSPCLWVRLLVPCARLCLRVSVGSPIRGRTCRQSTHTRSRTHASLACSSDVPRAIVITGLGTGQQPAAHVEREMILHTLRTSNVPRKEIR